MTKEVFRLPDFFISGSLADFFIHFYTANQDAVKNKVVYSQNMIGFLQCGIKEVHSPKSHALIDPKSILLLNSGSVLMSQSLVEKQLFKSILLFFSNKFIHEFMLRYAIEISNTESKGGHLFTIPKDEFLDNFECSLLLLKHFSSPELHKIKIEELLLYLLKKFPQPTMLFLNNALEKSSSAKIQQVVNENIEKGLNIEELAFLCNMSVSSFKRHFIETFSTSPKKYFTDFRMKRAKQLLLMKKRVSEIYGDLGYESLSAFSSEFKKYFGISPKQLQTEIEPKAQISEPKA